MSTVNNGPQIVSTGLILSLDASARRSYLPNSLINMSTWTIGTGGATGYNQNGNPSTENQRTLTTNPWGDTDVIWGSFPSGNGNDDGGWNTTDFNIDNTKLYRFSVWVKRTSSTSGGTFYLGMNAGGDGPRQMDNSTINTNPYWNCTGTGGLNQDVWYLYVGHVYPWNTSYTGRHPNTGYYFVNNPTKQGDVNGCNIGSGDLKWSNNSTTGIHRTYHYYCADSTTRLQFYDPRVDLVDGKEPSINELVNYSPAQWRNLTQNNINFSVSSKPIYSTTAKGLFNFNGSNTYFTAIENSLFNTETLTLECWARTSNVNQNGFFFEKGTVNSQYAIFIEGTQIKIRTNTGISGIADLQFTAASYIQSNVWFLVTASYNNGLKRFYINGVLLGTQTVTGGFTTNANGMSIGAYGGFSASTGRSYYYSGDIATMKFYNRVLTDAEVSQNFQATKTRFGL
jgi:hypothetical protein